MTDTNPRRLTIARAMAEAVQQEMQQDPRVFVMGEDIGALDRKSVV
jgi:pyruvate dehydrogenase E1 component beta subunit